MTARGAVVLALVALPGRVPAGTTVGRHVGRWSRPPEYCGPHSRLAGGNTDAPLLGNGDVGVNLCGPASGPTLYIGKNDFWSTYNADVTHNMYQSLASVARVQLDLTQLGESSSAATYDLQQHLTNASVSSSFGYGGGRNFTTRSFVAATSNVLVTELSSSVSGSIVLQLLSGSATGTKRGLPVTGGATRSGATIHVARNSCSTEHTHPSAVVRDCRDGLLDAAGQQSFMVDPGTGELTVLGDTPADRRCLLLLPDAPAPPIPVPTSINKASNGTWLTFTNHNAMFYPTKAANIHTIGSFESAAACQAHISSNASLAPCSIFAWSSGSQECYCREDRSWQFTTQAGRTSGCLTSVVNGCVPAPSPHPSPSPPHPVPPPPPPPPSHPCTAAQQCKRVGSSSGVAECGSAGRRSRWLLEGVAGTNWSRVVVSGADAEAEAAFGALQGKLCLTDSRSADTTARCGSMGGCFPRLEARPCLSNATNQLWALRTGQLRSAVAFDECVSAIPPVPLVKVAAALQVVGPDGSPAGAAAIMGTTVPSSDVGNDAAGNRQVAARLLADGSVEVNTTLRMSAGVTYTLLLAIVSSNDLHGDGDAGPGDVVSEAESLVQAASTPTKLASLKEEHLSWWQRYWNASAVDLGPERQTLEGFWYGMQYMAGSMNRAGKQATGLWGPWIQSDTMNWNGDYTLDYNFQSEYYGVFSSNHAELATNYFPVILKALPIGRRRAAYPHWGDRTSSHSGPAGMILSGWQNALPDTMGNYSGVELPSHVTAYGGYYMGDLGTRGLIGWVALPFVDHFEYTQDFEFLSNVTYGLLLEGADFFESYLTYHPSNQSYTLENGCALEGCTLPKNPRNHGKPQRNVAMTLGWIRATFQALLRFSTLLGRDTSRRPTWRKILGGLAPFPITTSENVTVFDECEDSGDFGGNARYPVVNFGHIHPAAQVTRRSSTPAMLQIARDTVAQINTLNDWVPDNGLCMAWPPAAMVTDNATRTSQLMQAALQRVMSPNFVPQIHGGCVAEQAGATQAINDLLIQSYDGVIELFPAAWSGDASFTTLRTRGAFLVSASWDGARHSVRDGVVVESEAGLVFSFVDFAAVEISVTEARSGASVAVTRKADVLSFPTSKGTVYTLRRSSPSSTLKTDDERDHTWSGPMVRPIWNANGVSALSIDGQISAPGFIVGNTQGGLADDWAAWQVELTQAAAAGVRIFGICIDGSDLLSFPEAVLTNHTRQMVERVLAAVPHALILPRVPIGTFLGAGSVFERVQIMAPAVCVGCPAWPGGNGTAGSLQALGYGSLTAPWAEAAAARMSTWLALLDGAYPGSIGGVHLAGLAAGEMRFECPPEDAGMADYSNATQAEFCASDGGAECTVPSAKDRCSPCDGNIFVSNSSASYNLFLSHQIQRAISSVAAAAKNTMANKGLVIVFYGYLNELGGHRISGSGHLALSQLLRDKNVDGIVSPYKYGPNFRHPTGPLVGMGTFDCGVVHGKLWISEDDSRTSLAKPSGFTSCTTLSCDVNLMRRNLVTTALHGAGCGSSTNFTYYSSPYCPHPDLRPHERVRRIYQFDLIVAGWFGRPGNATTTSTIWQAIASGRKAAEAMFKASEVLPQPVADSQARHQAAKPTLNPEVAVFTDDVSMGYTRANGVGTLDATIHPAEWLNDVAWQLPQIGAPVRNLHLRDLLLPAAVIDPVLKDIKLAVLPNAFILTDELKAAIAKLRSSNRTLLFYYAPSALSASTGLMSATGSEVADFIGCPIVRGTGSHSFVGEFVASSLPSSSGGCPDFASLAGQRYQPTVSGNPGPSSGPSSVLDPYYTMDRKSDDSSASGCMVLSRYSSKGSTTGAAAPAAAVCSAHPDHTVLLSAMPFPPEALRRVALASGIHLYVNTTVETRTPAGLPSTACTGDGVEATGQGLLVRAGHLAQKTHPLAVGLPPSVRGWSVTDEAGKVVCRHCHGFSSALDAGQVAAFIVLPEP